MNHFSQTVRTAIKVAGNIRTDLSRSDAGLMAMAGLAGGIIASIGVLAVPPSVARPAQKSMQTLSAATTPVVQTQPTLTSTPIKPTDALRSVRVSPAKNTM